MRSIIAIVAFVAVAAAVPLQQAGNHKPGPHHASIEDCTETNLHTTTPATSATVEPVKRHHDPGHHGAHHHHGQHKHHSPHTSEVTTTTKASPSSSATHMHSHRHHNYHTKRTSKWTTTTQASPSSSPSRVHSPHRSTASVSSTSAVSSSRSKSVESAWPYPSGSVTVTNSDGSTYVMGYSAPVQTTWTPDTSSFIPTEHVTQYTLTSIDSASSTHVTTTTTDEASCTAAAADYKETTLSIHNAMRANHSTNALIWDDNLACVAQRQANTCIWDHLMYIDGGGYGQNLAGGTDIAGAINMWYNEMPNFDGQYGLQNPGGDFENYGHYTQMIWASSTSIGCATLQCTNSVGEYTVCNYYGSGNVGPFWGVEVLPLAS